MAVVVKDNEIKSGVGGDVTDETVKNRNILQNCLGPVNTPSRLWYNSQTAHRNAQQSSLTGSLENSTLSSDRVEDGEVDKLIN